MRLVELVKYLEAYRPASLADVEVKGVTSASSEVCRGYVFVAIRGNRNDGHDYLDEAVTKGAIALIVQEPYQSRALPEGVSMISVRDTRAACARLCAAFYRDPGSRMRLTGITGTNGKTTITYLIEELLTQQKAKPGVIGTVNYRYANTVLPAPNTTPGSCALQQLLFQMAEKGVSHVIMEVSSHALEQGRVDGISFRSALFTNLTRDHLDFHGDMERYFRAKAKLFEGLEPQANALINADDPFGKRLLSMTRAKVMTFGIKKGADVWASDIRLSIAGSTFTLKAQNRRLGVTTPLIGRHNVYNALAAAAWAISEGIGLEAIAALMERPPQVPGRLERVDGRPGLNVFVDYAHTEDALRNVLSSLRQAGAGRIITVFGCGGDRDKGKRPAMGRAATELSDLVVITSDNPRSEAPEAIIADITAGIEKKNYTVAVDRRDAIAEACAAAKDGDIVLIAGKGHEGVQIFKDKTVAFDDREVVRECLQQQR